MSSLTLNFCKKLFESAFWLNPDEAAVDPATLRARAIQEGGAAKREFLQVIFGDFSDSEQERVRRTLELYYGQENEGVIWII